MLVRDTIDDANHQFSRILKIDERIPVIELQLKQTVQDMNQMMHHNHALSMQFNMRNAETSYHSEWRPSTHLDGEGNDVVRECNSELER